MSSTSHASAQETQGAKDTRDRRRKRKERSTSRAPEPKNVVSGAGQPLDPSVRRDLEEQLGHDLSRVRLHTDRDAGTLTDLLGADAVAVGQDIFFRQGAFAPGTADGRRLLAHELLHTVQNPHGLGALRAGRDLGAVSLPHEGIEREAESAAREITDPDRAAQPAAAVEPAAVQVEPGQATPGWLRYATVDADRVRAERLDPETVVDRLVNGVLRSLRGDPADASRRVRIQLARMSPDLQESVLDRLEVRLPTPDHERLVSLIDEEDQELLPFAASSAPHVVPDALDGVEQERQSEEAAWRARLDDAERLEDERIRAARQRKARDPQSDDGSSPAGAQPDGGQAEGAGAGTAGGPQPAAQDQQTAQAPAVATQLQVVGESDDSAAAQSNEAKESGTADVEPGDGPKAEPQQASQSTPSPRVADRRKESSAQPTDAARPASVDKSAAERDDTRTQDTPQETAESDQDPDDEPLGLEESGADEALAELEGLLAEAEEAEAAPEPEEPDQASLATDAPDTAPVDATTPVEDRSAERAGVSRPPAPRMSEAEVEALTTALEEEGQEEEETAAGEEPDSALQAGRSVDEEIGPDPDSSAADRPGAQSATGPADPDEEQSDREERAKDEAEDRELASETRRANQQSAAGQDDGESTGPADGADSGKLAKADEDARGQASPSGSGGGGGGSAGTAGSEGRSAQAPSAGAASASLASATRPAPGGDTGVTPAAEEVTARVPHTEAPPKHERTQPDDDRPVTVKAAPRARNGGSGGGGGGKAAAQPKKQAPAPNVSNSSPEAGLATAAGLKPHLALATLKGVNTAVGNSVGKERGQLKDAPPTMDRPVGSPTTVHGGPKPSAPGTYTTEQVGKAEAAQGSTPEIKGEKPPSGELPGGEVKEPSWWDIGKTIAFALGKKILSKILPLDKLTGSISDLPTTDKGLHGTKVGDAPKLPLKDDSDPERTDKQAKLLDDRSAELHESGRDDAARPMGEDEIYPDVPKETLRAKVGGGKGKGEVGGGGNPAGGPGAGLPLDAVSAVAEHEQDPQLHQAFGQAHQRMSTARREKETKAQRDRRQYQRDVKQEITTNTKEQAATRARGRSDIAASRASWRKEQDDKLTEVDGKKGKHFTKVRKDIKEKQDKTDGEVDQRTKDDQKKIDDQRTGAERDATQKRDDGKKDSGNWFERGLDWIKEQFTKLKNAIKDLFEKARKVVQGVIDDFKKQVFKLIDDARKWVIQQINDFADALIRLGDDLLKDYPAMRDKWRKSINGLRDAAIKKVNQAADKLKEVAGKLIDGFGGMLLAGLDLMEKGLLAAVDYVETVTVKALELGSAILNGLGEWAAIATDILSDPGGWISKAKDAAVTGSKQYLFQEIKTAVKEWFNQKVQQLIGIPMDMFNRLIKGGTSKEEMAKMAWDAALPQLPLIIGELIVTKIVAKLIPGAGWVMAIIDALKTAYDALSSVLRAFGLFMSFLKTVKSGNGALPFAKAVASGVVALLELIYQWLVSGVGKYLGKVGKILRGKAAKLGKGSGAKDGKDPKNDGKDPKKNDKGRPDDPAPSPHHNPKQKHPEEPMPGRKPTQQSPSTSKEKRDDDDRRRDGRYVNAARRGVGKAAGRLRSATRPDGKGPKRPGEQGPGTRRPNDRKPDAKVPDSKRPDLTKPRDKHADARKPAKDGKRPNKDAPGQKRPHTDKKQPKKPGVLSRVRDVVKNALARVRRALRWLGNKARQLLDKLKNLARKLTDAFRWMKERLQERRRNKRRPDERDDRRRVNPPEVPFTDADDGEHHMLKFHGRGPRAPLYIHSTPKEVPPFLAEWKNDLNKPETEKHRVRQESLRGSAEKAYAIVKQVEAQTLTATDKKERKEEARRKEYALGKAMTGFARFARGRRYYDEPAHKLQDFNDVSIGEHDRRPSENHISQWLGTRTKSVYGGGGQEAGLANSGQPPGWDEVRSRGLSEKTRWVRMHLLPARLGGRARGAGNNLVPARGPETNNKFLNGIEQEAYDAISPGETIISYASRAKFNHQDAPHFPSYIWAEYKSFKKVRGTGKERNDWEPKGPSKSFDDTPEPIADNEKERLAINDAGRPTIMARLLNDKNETLAREFRNAVKDFQKHGGLKSTGQVRPMMEDHKAAHPNVSLDGLDVLIENLRRLDAEKLVKWK